MNQEPSIFTKIINRELPADILFENDNVIIIKNIHPHAPIHLLGISKKPYASMHELVQGGSTDDKEVLWELFHSLSDIATTMGLDIAGYRLTTNVGEGGGQSIAHLHVHLLGGLVLSDNSLAK